MPRKRKRTTTKASWTIEALKNAVKTLQRGGTSAYKVSKETGIPYSTLKKRFSLAKSNNASYTRPPKLGRPGVFTEEQEAILADHLRNMSNKFYGLTRAQFCKTCYAMAETIGVASRFNEAKKSAGRDFLTGFFQRHPDLSIRKPEATSINRILGFNKVEVDRFFENLENVMTKHHFPPCHIYNMDETGVTTVQETEKIIAPRGQKRVGAVTSWERGKNVTAICAMSASGSFVPPLFIFPRQRHSPQLEKDGPPGAVYTCSHNGWTNESIFIEWLRHFIKHSKPTAEQPVLLIMDNHNSHSTLEAWELAKANNVVMLSIPPHSSHRLQPLDVTFFGPLKKAYNKECDMFIKSRNMVKITPYEIAGLFNKAYARVACLDKCISGFKSTGIFPMNPAVFSEDDFVAVDEDQNQINEQASSAAVAQSHGPVSQQVAAGDSDPLPSTSRVTDNSEQIPSTPRATADSDTLPSTSRGNQQELDSSVIIQSAPTIEQDQSHYTDPIISNATPEKSNIVQAATTVNLDAEKPDFAKVLSTLNPLPNISNKNKTSRQKQHSVILSSTPMKSVFEEKQKKRIEKNSKTKINPKKKGETSKVQENKQELIQKNKETSKKEKKCTTEKGKKQKKTPAKKGKMRRDNKKKIDNEADTSEEEDVDDSEEETLWAIQKRKETCKKERKLTTEKGKKRKKTTNKKEKVKRVKKKLFDDDIETSEEEDVENLCDDQSEYSDEETLCTICNDTGKSNEMWYRCRACGKWAHKECTGSDSPVDYICVFCLDP